MALIHEQTPHVEIPVVVFDLITVLDDALQGVEVEAGHVEPIEGLEGGRWFVRSRGEPRWNFNISDAAVAVSSERAGKG